MTNIKRYNEFNETEKKAIEKLNDAWFCAEMSDDYRCTCREEEALLRNFNETFGYNFHRFAMNGYGKIEETFFYNY